MGFNGGLSSSIFFFFFVLNPFFTFQIVDDNNQELSPGTTGRVVIRVKPYRPVNMFNCYVVRWLFNN